MSRSLREQLMDQQASFASLQRELDRVNSDVKMLIEEILVAVDENNLCDEYDDFVANMNDRLKCFQLLPRRRKVAVTFTITSTKLDDDEIENLIMDAVRVEADEDVEFVTVRSCHD